MSFKLLKMNSLRNVYRLCCCMTDRLLFGTGLLCEWLRKNWPIDDIRESGWVVQPRGDGVKFVDIFVTSYSPQFLQLLALAR